MFVDLHMHSYFSDGTMSPEEIVIQGKKNNIKVIALTDHNSLAGWERFQHAAIEEGLIPIKGVEINCKYKDTILHLLAYGFNDTPELLTLINQADHEMKQMSVDLVEVLAKEDPKVSLEDYEAYEYNRKNGGWKGLHYLLDRDITDELFQGFKYYREFGCDFIDYDFPPFEALCKAIKNASGYSVLAHPAEYYNLLPKEELLIIFEDLKEKGLQGVECYYPTHSPMLTDLCVTFCKENNLLITVGSDEHGEFGKQAKTLEQTIGCMGIGIDKVNLGNLL